MHNGIRTVVITKFSSMDGKILRQDYEFFIG